MRCARGDGASGPGQKISAIRGESRGFFLGNVFFPRGVRGKENMVISIFNFFKSYGTNMRN